MVGRKAIVIAVDGLRASALGAYGNAWYATPALDALAAESLVFDWMWCDSPELAGFYRSVWGQGATLLSQLAAAGGGATLVTDDGDLAAAAPVTFHEVVRADCGSPVAACDVAETATAQVLALAAERLASWNDEPRDAARLMWVHLRGFRGAWDAPRELRTALLDEGDPPAPTYLTPPETLASTNHDELLAHRAAYAAQAIVLDQCVGGLLDAVSELGLQDVLAAVVGCRGYALGEHGLVGGACQSLYGEMLHVPCLVRWPAGAPAPPRWTKLAHPSDLAARLARWFDLPPVAGEGDVSQWDDEASDFGTRRIIVTDGPGGERAVRTPAWFLRQPAAGKNADGGSPRRAELYVKADDRWEANEVADRCPEVVERLLAALDELPPGIRVAPTDWDADLLAAAK